MEILNNIKARNQKAKNKAIEEEEQIDKNLRTDIVQNRPQAENSETSELISKDMESLRKSCGDVFGNDTDMLLYAIYDMNRTLNNNIVTLLENQNAKRP